MARRKLSNVDVAVYALFRLRGRRWPISHRDIERSDPKPARTSSEKSFGCSQAAKRPPLSKFR